MFVCLFVGVTFPSTLVLRGGGGGDSAAVGSKMNKKKMPLLYINIILLIRILSYFIVFYEPFILLTFCITLLFLLTLFFLFRVINKINIRGFFFPANVRVLFRFNRRCCFFLLVSFIHCTRSTTSRIKRHSTIIHLNCVALPQPSTLTLSPSHNSPLEEEKKTKQKIQICQSIQSKKTKTQKNNSSARLVRKEKRPTKQ